MIITIDGPIATGKSTIAKKLATKLGFIFFDTGAMYRCLTYALLKNKINIDNSEELNHFLKPFTFQISTLHGEKKYLIGTEDVTNAIRGAEVTTAVSKVSAIAAVRNKLVALQKSLSIGVNAVFEGRDLGSVVFPKAELKIFLIGDTTIRAKRRFDELKTKFPKESENLTLEQTIADINRRDLYDSTRENSPLIKADDAYIIDTSHLSLDEIVYKIIEIKDSLPTI